jgi:hypothetical protein
MLLLTFFLRMTFLIIVVRRIFGSLPLFSDVVERPSFFLVDKATLILRVITIVVVFLPMIPYSDGVFGEVLISLGAYPEG